MRPVPVDIVLPCYNPNDTWHQELLDFYSRAKDLYTLNFILVNDGSVSGNVHDRVKQLHQQGVPVTYVSYMQNMGKGYALRQGVTCTESPFVIYTDVDFPFTFQSMADVINILAAGNCDIASGYRNKNYYDKSMSVFRKMLSKSFRFFIKNILGMATTDTQCGLKGFNAKGREKFLATKINRYLFDFEFIFTGSKDASIVIKTVPVQLKDNVVFSKMKLKILLQEMFNLIYILLFRKR